MKILELKVLKGPNYWSNHRKKLIVMKLDIGVYEEMPSSAINGFTERLITLMPSLQTHRCSVGIAGGFVQRMREGTWLGHVIEHVALELQSLAGMDCGFGRTRSAERKGVYNVVFSYLLSDAGVYAAKAAVRVVQAVAAAQPYDLQAEINKLVEIYFNQAYGPSTQGLVTEAESRGIPVTRLNEGSFVMFGHGKNQKLIRATVASTTSNIAVELASDKDETKQMLKDNYIPVPDGFVIKTADELVGAILDLGYPIAVKPLDGNHGRGITTNIQSKEQAINAFNYAKHISDDVIIEKYIHGDDYRFLVINYKLVAVSKRIPAMVTGDGRSTIGQLINQVNSDPRRGDGHEKVLTKITMDENMDALLQANGFTLSSILMAGVTLKLKDTANLSSGGTASDVTDLVHPLNRFLAERTARLIGLDICGIDIISLDITRPIIENGGAVLEVNAAPGFRMHSHPSSGEKRNVAAPVIDMLFPAASESRIPLVAVTGTNGKTTTTRLIAHLAKCTGYLTGFTCTDGIYIDSKMVTNGDCSGPASAAVVLRDPAVEFAVLECARGGILRSGLGFDHCNVSVVTNVTQDHLEIGGINTLKQLARVKRVVPLSTYDDGYAILNADDELVFSMKDELSCNIALFSTDPKSFRIREHCNSGGLAAIVEDGQFVLYEANSKTVVTEIKDVPLTLAGKSNCMVQNVLAAILAGYTAGISLETLRVGLGSFIPSPEMMPGRMNLFHFNNFRLIIDYAHNVGGFQQLKDYLAKESASLKIGIIAATGDRRDQDIYLLGKYAGEIFDEIIIRHDKDGRGRSNEEISELLMEGISSVNSRGVVTVISDEQEAIRHACTYAPENALIFVCCDEISKSLQLVRELKYNETIITTHES